MFNKDILPEHIALLFQITPYFKYTWTRLISQKKNFTFVRSIGDIVIITTVTTTLSQVFLLIVYYAKSFIYMISLSP